MKYKIIIYRYHSIQDSYESNSITDILKWYQDNWQCMHERGECAFDVYEDDRILTFEEKYKLGFYEDQTLLGWKDSHLREIQKEQTSKCDHDYTTASLSFEDLDGNLVHTTKCETCNKCGHISFKYID